MGAAAKFQQAIDTGHGTAPCLRELGLCLMRVGRSSDALVAFQRATEVRRECRRRGCRGLSSAPILWQIEPDYADAWTNIAQIKSDLGELDRQAPGPLLLLPPRRS